MNDEGIETVLQRLLLVGPTLARAKRLTVSFSAYHAVKLGSLHRVQAAAATNHYAQVWKKLEKAVQAYIKYEHDPHRASTGFRNQLQMPSR